MSPIHNSMFVGALVAVALTTTSAQAQNGRWRMEGESVIRFTCEGPDIDEPSRGRFITATGGVEMDPADLSNATGSIQVLLTSIYTNNTAWDAMFRAAHFLDIGEHPRAMFELHELRSRSAVGATWEAIDLVGRMTVKGVHNDVVIPARVRHVSADGDEPERVELLATFSLLWADYEIAVPRGRTREFAGDGARVRMSLVFTRIP